MTNSMTIRDRVNVRITVGDGFRFGVGVFFAALLCTVHFYTTLAIGGLSLIAIMDRVTKNQSAPQAVSPR